MKASLADLRAKLEELATSVAEARNLVQELEVSRVPRRKLEPFSPETTLAEAILAVLRDAGQAQTPAQITKAVLDRGLRSKAKRLQNNVVVTLNRFGRKPGTVEKRRGTNEWILSDWTQDPCSPYFDVAAQRAEGRVASPF